jgi:hypothetical protein
MIAIAILAGLVLGALGAFALGAGAAIWMGSLYGSNSGGTEMSSFFTFGPAGAIAGILLGVGLAFQFGGGPAGWAKGLMIGSASIFGIAVLALAGLALAHPRSVPQPASLTLYFELEVPAKGLVDEPNSGENWKFEAGQSYAVNSVEKNCSADRCLFHGIFALDDSLTKGNVTAVIGQEHYIFAVEPQGAQDIDLSEWQSQGSARFRWRLVR